MKCSCGQPLPSEGTVVVCSSCQRQNLTCSECGAHVTTAPEAVVAQCLYCSATLQHVDLSQGTPYFTVTFSEEEARGRLLTFLLNRFGIPSDFAQQFQVVDQRLVYLPVYQYRVTAWLTRSIFETDTKVVIASRGVAYRHVLDQYRFAVRAKVYADPRTIRGQVYPADVDRAAADREAWQFGGELLARDKQRFDEVPAQDAVQYHYLGSVYYPLYEITYRYGDKTFQTVFDACNGVVCQASHPMSQKARLAVRAAAMLYLGLAAVVAVAFALVAATGLMGLLDPVGVGGFGAAALVAVTAALVGGRMLSSSGSESKTGEEISATEHPIKVPELGLCLPVAERKAMQQAAPAQQAAPTPQATPAAQ
ncbi:MAG: hypothetical protein JRI23_04470 [Deltaproteobacteria bacterium]|jgi:hypothetical protein|nr:hypothetical protein [Deltaproteobacteria bacterium]